MVTMSAMPRHTSWEGEQGPPAALALRILCVRCLATLSTFGAFGCRATVLPLARRTPNSPSYGGRGNGTHDGESDWVFRVRLRTIRLRRVNPSTRANTLTTDVLMPIPYLRYLSSDERRSSFPLRLLRGSFPGGTSSDRLRPIPTKVRLNRLQGHRLKGRFWWFIGVYSHFSEWGKDVYSAEGAEESFRQLVQSRTPSFR